MSDLIKKAKAAIISSPPPTNTGTCGTKAAKTGEACVDSDIHQQNPRAGPSTRGGSVSGYGSAATDTTIHSANQACCNAPANPVGCLKTNTTCASPISLPHASNTMNKLDPRVDFHHSNPSTTSSARIGYDGSDCGSPTYIGQPSRTTPGHHASTNAGPHSSNTMNKLDPRVDSDCSNPTSSLSGNRSGGNTTTVTSAEHASSTPGTGNARQTAGPHNLNLLNKLDPRVDSDMDGSRTYGGKATHK